MLRGLEVAFGNTIGPLCFGESADAEILSAKLGDLS